MQSLPPELYHETWGLPPGKTPFAHVDEKMVKKQKVNVDVKVKFVYNTLKITAILFLQGLCCQKIFVWGFLTNPQAQNVHFNVYGKSCKNSSGSERVSVNQMGTLSCTHTVNIRAPPNCSSVILVGNLYIYLLHLSAMQHLCPKGPLNFLFSAVAHHFRKQSRGCLFEVYCCIT